MSTLVHGDKNPFSFVYYQQTMKSLCLVFVVKVTLFPPMTVIWRRNTEADS